MAAELGAKRSWNATADFGSAVTELSGVYLPQAPVLAGAFHFFNQPKQLTNQPSLLGTIERSKY
ncbi:hypothetical protein SynBIOSE41_01887 [Synechococcus sp. BIOS-E4-1]|nr:hypothetical protein SynBIOSE41_01887 [Synechococcus sp. BIOS-E4-1]